MLKLVVTIIITAVTTAISPMNTRTAFIHIFILAAQNLAAGTQLNNTASLPF